MSKVLLNFLIGIFSSLLALAQTGFREGYILQVSNDTIFGEVDNRAATQNQKSCRFRAKDRVAEYLPSDILGYGFHDGTHFSSQIVAESFAELLILGELDLYKAGEKFFIRTGEGEIHELARKDTLVEGADGVVRRKVDHKWKRILYYLVKDCIPDADEQLKTKPLAENYLIKIVERYNRCADSGYEPYKREVAWRKVNFGIIGGPMTSFVNTDESQTGSGLHLGALIELALPRLSERLSFHFSPTYTQYNTESTNQRTISSETTFRTDYLEVNALGLNVDLKYRFSDRNYSFFGVFGISAASVLSSNAGQHLRIVNDGTELVNIDQTREVTNVYGTHLGPGAGVGFSKKFDHLEFGLIGRYWLKTPFLTVDGRVLPVHQFDLGLMVLLR